MSYRVNCLSYYEEEEEPEESYCLYDNFLCDSETCKFCSRVIEEPNINLDLERQEEENKWIQKQGRC